MFQYILRRLLLLIPTLFGVSILVFSLIKLAPGSVEAMVVSGAAGESGAAAQADLEKKIQKFREDYLLDRSLLVQYFHYIGPFNLHAKHGHPWFGGNGDDKWNGLLSFDLGKEFLRPDVSVIDELGKRLKVTVPLALISVLLSYLIALPIGVFSAIRQGHPLEVGSTVTLFLLYAVPTFWAGLLLQMVFGVTGLDWLPVLGLNDKNADTFTTGEWWWDLVKHAILPIAVYSYGSLAYLSRQMRVGVVDSITQDYVRTARAKGLDEKVVIYKHVLRNSVIPIITLLASILPILIGGSIIVETVFEIPGMGRYAFEGLVKREYNVIMATTMFSALMTILGILMSDILYAIVDPRIRYD